MFYVCSLFFAVRAKACHKLYLFNDRSTEQDINLAGTLDYMAIFLDMSVSFPVYADFYTDLLLLKWDKITYADMDLCMHYRFAKLLIIQLYPSWSDVQ